MNSASVTNSAEPPAHPTFGTALRFWFVLGCIGFGGPAGQIATLHRELVERRRWIGEGRFMHALNYCMLLPGPEATQLAVYIGWLLHGVPGGVAAGVLFVLPGALLLTVLSYLYVTYGELGGVQGVIFGFQAAVVALIASALLRIGGRAVRSPATLLIALGALAAVAFQVLSFPLLIVAAGVLGLAGGRYLPQQFTPAGKAQPGQAGAAAVSAAPALLDEGSPTPAHATVRPARLALIAAVFAVLIGGPPLLLTWALGAEHTFAQMARFFTLAAFVTVGGAYAVLPYVQRMATEVYGWLQPGQMMAGMALGETTPGPLILVLTFVGFVGGFNREFPALGWSGALLGAGLATYCTFIPSFMFILLGGPFVERTRGELRLGAVLTAISAAVVGVIAHMALSFGVHALFPEPVGRFSPAALGLIAGALLALQWWKLPSLAVVPACGVLGLLAWLAGAV